MLITDIAVLGAFLWGGAALATGVPRGLVDSEVSFLFTIPAIIGSLVGVTGWTPATADAWLLALAGVVYLSAPVVLAAWLLHHREAEEREKGDPKTIT